MILDKVQTAGKKKGALLNAPTIKQGGGDIVIVLLHDSCQNN